MTVTAFPARAPRSRRVPGLGPWQAATPGARSGVLVLGVVVSSAALLAGGCSDITCGEGTVAHLNTTTGATECVLPDSKVGIPCDPQTAKVEGGVCKGVVECGAGTVLEPVSRKCVPSGTTTGKMCMATQPAGAFCVFGSIGFLKTGMSAKGTSLEVRGYDPLAFLSDPKGAMPQAKMTTDDGTYALDGLKDTSGQALIAIAVSDASGQTYILAGSGQDKVQAGQQYKVDLVAIERTLVATWDQQAGYSGADTFEGRGAYLARFVDGSGKPAAGVTLTFNGQAATDTWYFKGDFSTLDKNQTSTDAATGAAIQRVTPGSLGNYGGMGGGTWPAVLGASVPDVVFVTTFRPKT